MKVNYGEEEKRLMSEQRATRNSYSRHQPMPETKARMQVSQTFTDEEYQRMQMGTIPQEMEDKWFIYFEDGWFFFHRSWTGICIYQVRLELTLPGSDPGSSMPQLQET